MEWNRRRVNRETFLSITILIILSYLYWHISPINVSYYIWVTEMNVYPSYLVYHLYPTSDFAPIYRSKIDTTNAVNIGLYVDHYVYIKNFTRLIGHSNQHKSSFVWIAFRIIRIHLIQPYVSNPRQLEWWCQLKRRIWQSHLRASRTCSCNHSWSIQTSNAFY